MMRISSLLSIVALVSVAGACSSASDQGAGSSTANVVGDTCPALSPPHPDFCPDGTLTPQEDADGCTVGYDCEAECPALSPPHPDFCPDGTITPQQDANGCTVGFDCVAPEAS
jgi:hypothetical protein